MISLADQSLAELGGHGSVLARQKRDHIKLDRLLGRLARTPAAGQPPILLKIYRLVFPHAFAEESVIWPVMRRVLPDGQRLTLEVEREHQAINERVARLEDLPPGSAEHRQVLSEVIDLLRQDVRDEEDVLLPRLQGALTPAQLRRLGLVWETVRRTAPTRAHPLVSRRPPGNVLSALPLTVLDRARDGVDAALHDDDVGGAAAPLRAAGSAIAQAAHLVEHLPGMTSGEDPSTRRGGASMGVWVPAAVVTIVTASLLVALLRRRRKPVAADAGSGREPDAERPPQAGLALAEPRPAEPQAATPA